MIEERTMQRNDILSFLRDFKTRCADKYGIISLGVFGSVARGEIHENSDVDIYVTTREPDPFVLAHIKMILSEDSSVTWISSASASE